MSKYIENEVNAEKILKYECKFVKVVLMVIIMSPCISLFGYIIVPTSNLWMAAGLMFLVGYLPVIILVLILDILNGIKTNKALKRDDIDEIKRELESKNVINLQGTDIYFTDNYIISNTEYLKIAKYDDIKWVYAETIRNHTHGYGLEGLGLVVGLGLALGTAIVRNTTNERKRLVAYLKDDKKVPIANIKTNQINMFYEQIYAKNNEVSIGDTAQNRKIHENLINKEGKKILLQTCEIMAIVILGLIIAALLGL